MRKIIKLFESGNVSVFGLRGRGKDLLMSNVVIRRNQPYVCNTDYGGQFHRLHLPDLNCGGNTYRNFLSGKVNKYVFPYPDGTDIYISDAGVYFPAQYCNELNKEFGYISTFMALSRHLGESNFHYNVQNLNRCWDKIREQSDIYICCNWSKIIFGKIVLQRVTIYEYYDSAVKRIPPYRAPSVRMSADRSLQIQMAKQNYRTTHGDIKSRLLLYINKSNYDTRIFKKILESV